MNVWVERSGKIIKSLTNHGKIMLTPTSPPPFQ